MGGTGVRGDEGWKDIEDGEKIVWGLGLGKIRIETDENMNGILRVSDKDSDQSSMKYS